MADGYTKAILTLIALALGAIAIQNAAPTSNAQIGRDCGQTYVSPCFITMVR